MKHLVKTLLLLAVIGCALAELDNLTHSPRFADQLEKEISEYHAQVWAHTQGSLKKLRDAVDDATDSQEKGSVSNNFVCTGGKDPSQITYKEYLKDFAAGPCTPVMVLAGVSGTKLQVEIDCPTFMANNPTLFADCKWTTCKKYIWEINEKAPKEEYAIWMPDTLSPMNIVNPSETQKKCFTGLLGLRWQKNSQGQVVPLPVQGISIKPMGLSKNTKTNSRCGFDALCNILPISKAIAPAIYRVYEELRIQLEKKGYVIGLTLQAMPYDWRLPYYDNQVHHEMISIIETMASINGKRVSVVAHSMGNINAINIFSQMSDTQRNSIVHRYFALAPPYLGSPKTWSMLIGSAGDFNSGVFGMDFFTFSRTTPTFNAIYDLMPRATWSLFKDSNWMKSIKNRIATEKGQPLPYNLASNLDITSKIFPKSSETCYNKKWTARSSDLSCKTGLDDFTYFGSILNTQVNDHSIHDSLKLYSMYEYAAELFDKEDVRLDYDRMDNPEVETVIVYSTIVATDKEYHWTINPTTVTKAANPNFCEPNSVIQNLGDGAVIVASTLSAGLKWAYEFDQKTNPQAKPIVFAELCSTFNQKTSVYQTGNKVTANQYQGIACGCEPKDTKPCGHTGMVSETNLVAYVSNSLMDSQVAKSDRKFDNWTEAQIKSYVENCELLNQSV